ncbi:unnamed protein product, partial [Symbiodinium microadriaticum]
MDRSRTPPPRSGLPSQPCQHGLPPFPLVPPPPPSDGPVLTPPHRPLQYGHWPSAPAHSTIMPLHPTLGSMPGLAKTIFPGHSFTSFPGSPGGQTKATAPEPLSPVPVSGYPSTPRAPVVSGGHGTATPHPPMTLPVPEDWLQDNDYLDTRRSMSSTCCVILLKKELPAFPVTNLHPAHFLYQGWNSYWLRWIAAGKEAYFIVARTKAEMVLAGQNLRQLPLQFSPGSNLGTSAKPEPSSIMQPPQEGSPWLASHFPAKCHDKELRAWINSLTLNDRKQSELQDWLKQVEDWVEAQDTDDFLTKIRRTAVIWGVPPATVTKLQKQPLAKLIAVGSYMERHTQAAAKAFRCLVGGLAPDILHFDFPSVFRALGIVPGCPSFQQFSAESVLYLRFSPIKKHAKLFYVGSTEKSVMIREHSRFRKYKQVLEEKLVSAELSIRFWAHHRTFWNWCIVPVTDVVPHDLLRGREQALIQTLQPPLNFPFIARWFCPRRGIIKPPDATHAQKIGLSRLWRKRRKKQHSGAGPPRGLTEVFEQIWEKHLTQAFSKGDVYELLRQDLAGFFNSISQSQFLHAWRITLEFYRRNSCESFGADVAPGSELGLRFLVEKTRLAKQATLHPAAHPHRDINNLQQRVRELEQRLQFATLTYLTL